MTNLLDRVAIVGQAIRLPGAGARIEQFWANVASASDCSTVAPEGRWPRPAADYLDPRIPHPDSVYSVRGYFLEPFTPDLTHLRIDSGFVGELDTLFHIVLDAGNRAWQLAKTDRVNRARVGVILGNICLPTDKANALCREWLGGANPSDPVHPLNRYVAGLPAGLLARALGLGGGSFTLDAACASSLYAIKLAADELLAGRADAMLAGGVNGSDSHYTQMGFAQLRALSASGRCSPFDGQADGLMVGEGAAVFVLKRVADAIEHGDTILATIAGAGLSNDMRGNLLAPAKEGQLRAMKKAYEQAGWRPQDVDLIECHATGTPVGDAVEFESLRELWSEGDWRPGQCVIGSAKSTVGHLLTGAGAAATAKVLGALARGVLPPQANFQAPNPALHYKGGPFIVATDAQEWPRREPGKPRRAAVSGFGFGGVNAHLLLEEWTGATGTRAATASKSSGKLVSVGQEPAKPRPSESQPAAPKTVPIAVVGLAAHFGPWSCLKDVEERILGVGIVEPQAKVNGWPRSESAPSIEANGVPSTAPLPRVPGYFIEELRFPINRFRIPPKELEETLPQQLLMLQVAAAALDDSGARLDAEDPATGVFIGLGLDPNTTNYHLRWSILARDENVKWGSADAASPALNANRVMGALGSIAASRIARAFHFGGPSHTVCSEEASGARAIELAVRALAAGELDRALVGGVDLAGDPRLVLPGQIHLPGEGAAAFVLKRLDDAEREGDRIYATITGLGAAGGGDPDAAAPSPEAFTKAVWRACTDAGVGIDSIRYTEGIEGGLMDERLGQAGAASSAARILKACLALHHTILPAAGSPQYWLHDRANGPRRAVIASGGADGTAIAVVFEEHSKSASNRPPEWARPPGSREETLLVVEGDSPADLSASLDRLASFISQPFSDLQALARNWFRESPLDSRRSHAVSFVARGIGELRDQIDHARSRIANRSEGNPFDPSLRDRVFYSPTPLGPHARIAFVFPGSGNQFEGMGRDLALEWPEVIRRQESENQLLRSQFAPEFFWNNRTAEATHRDLMFGQVTVGSLVADLLGHFGVRHQAMIGLSLGESAGLFGIRAWQSRDEMHQRMKTSTLFNSDLAPPFDAARRHWGLKKDQAADWASGIVSASSDDVLAAMRPGLRAYLLIINTPNECVIGGQRGDVEKLAAAIGKPYFPLTGVTLAHCEAGQPVSEAYRELHTLPATPPEGVTVYSGAWGKPYKVTEKAAADSITAGLLNTIDFPAVVQAAYRDGVRIFLEVGPGASCTRMIGAILEGKPHLARAVHAAKIDAVSQVLRALGALVAERVPVKLELLFQDEPAELQENGPRKAEMEMVIPVGMPPPMDAVPEPEIVEAIPLVEAQQEEEPALLRSPLVPEAVPARGLPITLLAPMIEAACSAQVATMQAQEAFLRVNQGMMETGARIVRFQAALLEAAQASPAGIPYLPPAVLETRLDNEPPRSLNFQQCCTFAIGKIGDVLGPLFAEVDSFPTRVRLPDGPLQLVDQIQLIEGEPKSMKPGRVVTDHAVRTDRWYLENGRIPTAISVEAGQADLFLSGFLGIDFQTRGLAVYRLLDAVVSFHRGLPKIGETIVYDIRIEEFTHQAGAWLFRFRFDGTVNGEPFITMRNGVAGFFTADALAAGRGIVQTSLDRQQLPGKKPLDWKDLAPQQAGSLSESQVEALRAGDLVAAFGKPFEGLPILHPLTIPGGMLRLVDRVPLIDPHGGRFGIGFVRAEFDIHPDDWFLTCHFVDDQVMPGTLMYECCLHTLRIFLLRLGWVGETGEVICEPIPGVQSRLKCRGQVIATTKTVTYEVTLKELGYDPAPYCIADALMYADGKPIVEIANMCLRMPGLTRERLEAAWAGRGEHRSQARYRFGRDHILAYASGNPSEAFGEQYRPFDRDRVLARLPAPPFSFIDRITPIAGQAFVLEAGAACRAEYEAAPNEWYFEANRGGLMPFCVLLEIALQPCGWLAAYCGSALTSDIDMSFRNLGGKATQFLPITPEIGTLTMTAKMTSVSRSAGMIIQHYDMLVTGRQGKVYEGTTYFGFFTKNQLANQVGIREAKVPWPEEGTGERGELPHESPFPAPMLRMVDRIAAYLPQGGSKGLGLVVGKIDVDPEAWFFKAHFVQDPVWPGSLGLESFLQLLKYVAWRKWGAELPRRDSARSANLVNHASHEASHRDPGKQPAGWQTPALARPHSWTYRGQVLPTDREVTVILEVTESDEAARSLVANGFLIVDGRVIYQMADFTLN